MTRPPADRKHGTGDRNDGDVAKLDEKLQDRRDDKKEKGAGEVKRQSHRDMGIEHP
ncbi:MAG: hypothetical protein ACTHL5_10325 [Rhodanobacter sp.]